MKKKLNGATKWIMVGLAILTILYNTIVAHVIMKNDVHHLQLSISKMEIEIRDIRNYLLDRK